MPTSACQFFYDCQGCGALLRPKQGDCCVYCSYGDVKCPPIQAGDQCCWASATNRWVANNLTAISRPSPSHSGFFGVVQSPSCYRWTS